MKCAYCQAEGVQWCLIEGQRVMLCDAHVDEKLDEIAEEQREARV